MHLSPRMKFGTSWLLIGAVAAVVCCLHWSAAHLGNEPLPVGIDSFYHARRMLDTALDPTAFYQFDTRIHAPEGSLLSWPWGYDYALGWLGRLAVIAGIAAQPMEFLIWVPVITVFLSVGLVMLIARQLSLSMWSTVLAALCVAVSPLTQLLHGIGMLDHHFAEYILVLAMVLLGLKWLAKPDDKRVAITLGVVLGIAPAIHNGLFILQLPLLANLLVLWLQGRRLPQGPTLWFCVALLLATIAVLLPSLAFRLGRFEFYTLSWFHLYIAAGTAITTVLLAWLPCTRRNLALLVVTGAILALPLGRQLLVAETFLAGTTQRLNAISEMQSIRQMSAVPGGWWTVTNLYSLVVWLAPLSAAYCLWRCWVERWSPRLFFWIYAVLGLALLATQYRLHYFGSLALFLPWLDLTERAVSRWPVRRKQIMLLVSLALLLMNAPPLRYQIPSQIAPAGDPGFASLRFVLDSLRQACAEDPGIVLADNDAGHYIRYYTDCSVIANNFLLTRQHEEKIEQIDYLTSLSAQALPDTAPYVRYLLLRPVSITRLPDNHVTYMTFSPKSTQLLADLLLSPVAQAPERYTLLSQANVREANGEEIPYIRVYKIAPAAARSGGPAASRIDAAR
jgi:hypothetical protein